MHPDSRICSQFNSCTVIILWLRLSLYRDTALVLATSFVTGDNFAAPIFLVPRNCSNSQNLYPDGKKCAIPSLHRDSFSAKVPGLCPDAASGITTSLYCRPLYVRFSTQYLDIQRTSKSLAVRPCNHTRAAKHMLFAYPIFTL
jgi:hypothetical protein